MNKVKTFVNIAGLFITLPMNYAQLIILYKHVKAPEIVWVLFFINLPVLMLVQIINAIVTKDSK